MQAAEVREGEGEGPQPTAIGLPPVDGRRRCCGQGDHEDGEGVGAGGQVDRGAHAV